MNSHIFSFLITLTIIHLICLFFWPRVLICLWVLVSSRFVLASWMTVHSKLAFQWSSKYAPSPLSSTASNSRQQNINTHTNTNNRNANTHPCHYLQQLQIDETVTPGSKIQIQILPLTILHSFN